MVSVELRVVSKKFSALPVLSQITLDIHKGETFFIMGASGSGKTTLLRIIAGLETPDAGAVLFGGIDVTELPVDVRGAGFVFQNYCLWPHMTVAENIEFGLEMASIAGSERRARSSEVCRLTQLSGLESRYPHELSGGQQQRVALARALAIKPRVLLLDEPLSNLDQHLRSSIREELRELTRHLGITTIYVSHDFDDALNLADRVGFLERGMIAQVDTPRAIYEHPRTESTARFLGSLVVVPPVLHRRDGMWWTRPEWFSIGEGLSGTIIDFEFDAGGAAAHIALAHSSENILVNVPLHEWRYERGSNVQVSIDPSKLLTFSPS